MKASTHHSRKTKHPVSNNNYLFESSWEVCNRVGGIYTVLASKAKFLQEVFADNLIFIGPDIWEQTENPLFVEDKKLFAPWQDHVEKHHNFGMRVGRWKIDGNPIAILVSFDHLFSKKNEIYAQMWNDFGVDSLHAYGDYDESSLFAYTVGEVIESFYHFFDLEQKEASVLAHFNEWMLGMGLLYLKKHLPRIATVFTTHATTIGRSIAGNNKPLYSQLNNYNGDQMSRELNVEAKHSIEKQAAHHADCFTTVSHITAIEASHLLEKEPIVTPNGFQNTLVQHTEKLDKMRQKARKTLIDVAKRLTGKNFSKEAFIIATSGRYEYKNKGLDLFVDALNRLKQITPQPNREVIAFILVPAWVKEPRTDLQERLKDKRKKYKEPLNSPFITHWLNDMDNDPIIQQINYLGLNNDSNSNVNVIFIPSYLHGTDGILNTNYYEVLSGIDLSVFPSYYEPWGYTPHESIAFGVPTITTSLAGFGIWNLHEDKQIPQSNAVYVVERRDDNSTQVSQKIAQLMYQHMQMNPQEAQQAHQEALKRASKATWKHFIEHYYSAYQQAQEQAKKRI